jgi:hypothetical protein
MCRAHATGGYGSATFGFAQCSLNTRELILGAC